MATKITREVLESYLYCKTKAHLKLAGQQGSMSDYEAMLAANTARSAAAGHRQDPRKASRRRGGERHLPDHRCPADGARRSCWMPTWKMTSLSLLFDGLKRVDEPSKLGAFQYVPLLFHEGRRSARSRGSCWSYTAWLLSRLQGQMPPSGIIWHGKECKTTRVRLDGDLRKTERLLREVKELVGAESPPRLILNDHCQVCEFRQRCHDEAVREDNISLLRGMGEKEVKSYARKGIFTVSQLAHTFRPRRRGKRAAPKVNHRYHALQALAVRDKRVYLFGTPQLPEAPVHIYLDIEGNPDEGFDYLIGMIVVEGGKEQHFSFWADSRDQEDWIFEQFLGTVARYQNFLVFCLRRLRASLLPENAKAGKAQGPS